MTPPRFRLGERVMVCTVEESGVLIDHGVIVGLEFSPPGAAGGWWYAVKFTDGPSAGYQEQTPQEHITLMTLRPQLGTA